MRRPRTVTITASQGISTSSTAPLPRKIIHRLATRLPSGRPVMALPPQESQT